MNSKKSFKADKNKPKLSLIPPLALEETAKVFTYGAKKYADNNWLLDGFLWTRLIDAALRHINAFNRGEDLDLESKLSHVAHAICCLMMLYDTTQIYPKNDNRWNGWKKYNEYCKNKNSSKKYHKKNRIDNRTVKKRKKAK